MRLIAINLILVALIVLPLPTLAATPVGQVLNLKGQLFARKADDNLKCLSLSSEVEAGDILVTGKRSYARIKFIDDSLITLRPETEFEIKEFQFSEENSNEDSAVLNLVKGGLRSITGQIGKRGTQDDYRMESKLGTIGIRGTIFTMRLCESNCGEIADGLYVSVIDGAVDFMTSAGTLRLNSGNLGFAEGQNRRPALMPPAPQISPELNTDKFSQLPFAEIKKSIIPDQGACEVR